MPSGNGRKAPQTESKQPWRKHMQPQPGPKIEQEEAQVTTRRAGWSPRLKARVAGVLYALEGTGAVFGGVYFRSKFLVSGNAAATATAIGANEPLFWAAFAAALLAVAFHLAYTVLLYDLFRP